MTPLETTVWKRMAVFLVVLALMIFLPAWTLNYWQGWLLWAVFSAATVWISDYFLKHDPALAQRRLNAGAAAETETSQKIIQAFASIFVIATFVLSAFDHGRGWSHVPGALSIAANAVVLLGFYIMFETFRANTFAASTVRVEEAQRVISNGPYAVVRHPMYAGALPMFLAVPVALGSWWGLVPAALLCAVIVVRLLDEERVLRQQLAGYEQYCRDVRYRLIPTIW
jgi:protein-S-isoprenylcysteine O-methyltransferase Ste14